jgi:primosomal protein N' (replication factor Y)
VVLGVVSGPAPNPKFTTKPILKSLDLPVLPKTLLGLADWILQYYPAPIGILAQSLLPAGISSKAINEEVIENLEHPDSNNLPPLTSEQKSALKVMTSRDSYILHGKTGSGKTRIYLELALKNVKNNKSVIILTPEISLTSQLADTFDQVFGNRVVVMHSNLTPASRQRVWIKCLRSTEPLIVIGARSALFMPVNNIGLIVLDESHESAYKQEQAPQYQTARVAAYLAKINMASLVLGSATPSIADYYLAKQRNKPIIELTKLAQQNSHKNEIIIVDKKDYSLFNKSNLLSKQLIEAIEKALNNGEQSLLYLNRRGTARIIMCQSCGWQANCPHCDIPLTYHSDKHHLRCHSCVYSANAPSSCPSCGQPDIIYKSAGTKAVVNEIERLFPSARVARYDTDNSVSESFERNFQAVKKGEIDIIVGTQMLAKGLDLPKLTTLGVILADSSLYMPDYTAEERTFQLINQVLGRIGRGHGHGKAIIQTYHPDHEVLKNAVDSDYQNFYSREIKTRQQYMFPPFCFILKVTFKRASVKSVESAALQAKNQISASGIAVRIEGPAPSFYEKISNKYQWQLIIKSKNRSNLLEIIKILPKNCSYDIDPLDIL